MTSSTVIHQPTTRRWTRVEYKRLVELGVFQPGERLELLDGALVVREPQGSRHAAAIRKVLAALRGALGETWADRLACARARRCLTARARRLRGAARARRLSRCAPGAC